MSDQRIVVSVIVSVGCVSNCGLPPKGFHWVLGLMLLIRTLPWH